MIKAYLLLVGMASCPDADEYKGIFTDVGLLKKAYDELVDGAGVLYPKGLRPAIWEFPLNLFVEGIFANTLVPVSERKLVQMVHEKELFKRLEKALVQYGVQLQYLPGVGVSFPVELEDEFTQEEMKTLETIIRSRKPIL